MDDLEREKNLRKWLRSWPYHVSKIDAEGEKSLIENGLIKDLEYGVYVHPQYGAFYWNQNCSSIEELVDRLKKDSFVVMSSFVDDPFSDFINSYENGYEFEIGPYINYLNRFDDSFKGIYCKNYRKMVEMQINNIKNKTR